MRYRTLALILALTIVAWAQTATPNVQSSTAPADQTKCACCDKAAAADAKSGQSCARHMAQSTGKELPCCGASRDGKSCCGRKAKSCVNGAEGKACCSRDKTASSCCRPDCSKTCGQDCCAGF
jgi:hypothetical protein